jgi:hypothetical protein
MKPDRSNYEIWVIDWLDGNLSDQQAEDLMVFLNENPDLKDEIEGIALVNLRSGKNFFFGKESLKKTAGSFSQSQFEHLCIAYLEDDLNLDQRSELLEIISNDENKKREFDQILKLKLKPPLFSYAGKKRIKKLTTGQKIIRMAAAGLSAAAAVLVLVVVFLSSPSDLTKDKKQALNSTNPDTLIVPLYPSIVVKDKEPSTSQKRILHPKLKITIPETQIPEQNVLIAQKERQSQPDSTDQVKMETAISVVNVSIPENIIKTSIPNAIGLLAYNKFAIVPSPFEEDRSNVDRFFARLFHEKIMRDKAAGSSPVKSYDLAIAGITGLNKLFGWEIALHKNTDETGQVKSYYFSSKLLKFNTPVKKDSDSL